MPKKYNQPRYQSPLTKVKSQLSIARQTNFEHDSSSFQSKSKKNDQPNNLHSSLLESTSLDKKLNSETIQKVFLPNHYFHSQIKSCMSSSFTTKSPLFSKQGSTIIGQDTSWTSKNSEDFQDKTSTEQSSIQQIDYINSEYQLSGSSLLTHFKKVDFKSETILLENKRRQSLIEKKNQLRSKTRKNASILKNTNRFFDHNSSTSTEKSYSAENSLVIRRKNKNSFGNVPYSGNNATKEKYIKYLRAFKGKNGTGKQKQECERSSFVFQEFQYKTASNIDVDETLQGLCRQKQKNDKFVDEIFPALYSSIFRVMNPKSSNLKLKEDHQKGKQIEWMRLSDLFKGKKVKIFNNVAQKNTQIKIYKSQFDGHSYYESDMVVGALNAIKNNRLLLYKIFDCQEDLNPYGIYLVNIYVDNYWKYVIVDDYIPVIRTKTPSFNSQYCQIVKNSKKTDYRPAFLDLGYSCPEISQNQSLYLWPFLVEKAYASYYSCYGALNYGKILDFLTELCGVPYQVVKIPELTCQQDKIEYQTIVQKIGCLLRQKSIVALAFSDEELPYVPIHLNKSILSMNEESLFYDDPLNSYEPAQISLKELNSLFSKIYLFNTQHLQYSSYSEVYPIKNKEDHQYVLVEKELIRESTSLRTFSLEKFTNGFISIRQKQNRLYMKKDAEYLWVRAFLFAKLYDGEYQWIDGKYNNKKSISFKVQLPPGQYFLLIMPEWRQSHNRQITILFDSDNESIKFQRQVFQPEQKIIELGCMDLAQKKGQLHQISSFICSYTVVSKSVGIIIENVCNERPKGEITVMRSIKGLKARCPILPVNFQFYRCPLPQEQKTTDQRNFRLSYTPEKPETVYKELKGEIEVDIPALQNFTIVLKMTGGIDIKFFNAFRF